jgi:hypothetical protein
MERSATLTRKIGQRIHPSQVSAQAAGVVSGLQVHKPEKGNR